jgi:hypothetical protein
MLRRIIVGSVLALACASIEARAQDSARAEMSRWVFAGSDAENYLRYLQSLGIVREYPWSVRAFSSGELRRLQPQSDGHPWANARSMRSQPILYNWVQVDVAPAEVRTWYNTAFPFGINDGAVWVGRGLTTQLTGGVSVRWGPAELTLAPTVFWAENRDFNKPVNGPSAFADPAYPTGVDRPQRFGPRGYGAIDPGQSSLRLALLGFATGVSYANEWWGPMSDFPFILSNNAPGFAHVFFGTARPLNIGVGRVHTRILYGRLEQSAFSPMPADSARRFVGGIVATFQPLGFPGLELGASRFMHVPWPDSGLTSDYFKHLFETFLKRRIRKDFLLDPRNGSSIDNQLASAFARWTLARSGFEMYVEYGREDHSVNAYDLLLELDHSAVYGLGLRKAWRSDAAVMAMRAEIMNFQPSTLLRHRAEGGTYGHTYTRQGHTNRGQLLGAAIGVSSGAGATVVLERFDPVGFWQAHWSRLVVRDVSRSTDVQYILGVERRVRRSHNVEARFGLEGVYEFNRNYGGDVGNIRGEIGAAWYP